MSATRSPRLGRVRVGNVSNRAQSIPVANGEHCQAENGFADAEDDTKCFEYTNDFICDGGNPRHAYDKPDEAQ